MVSRELIVMIVQDYGLRSLLIGRLSLDGEILVTLNRDPLDPQVARVAAPDSVLIIDVESLGDRLEALLAEDRWSRIIILSEQVEETGSDRSCMIDPRGGYTAVCAELARWRGGRAS